MFRSVARRCFGAERKVAEIVSANELSDLIKAGKPLLVDFTARYVSIYSRQLTVFP